MVSMVLSIISLLTTSFSTIIPAALCRNWSFLKLSHFARSAGIGKFLGCSVLLVNPRTSKAAARHELSPQASRSRCLVGRRCGDPLLHFGG